MSVLSKSGNGTLQSWCIKRSVLCSLLKILKKFKTNFEKMSRPQGFSQFPTPKKFATSVICTCQCYAILKRPFEERI